VLFIDDQAGSESAEGRELRAIGRALEEMGFQVLEAADARDGWMNFISRADLGCVVLDWDLGPSGEGGFAGPGDLVFHIRERNEDIPLFVMAEKMDVRGLPPEVLGLLDGYIWKLEDTPDFIAGRIEQAVKGYVEKILPPFFGELLKYVMEYKYAWHTPGHTGGVAFLKSPVGRMFFEFFGENTLRSDLSISVPELGSLLEHSEVVGRAEKRAAAAFGAERTYFVTNGTSTANKIVWHGCVTPGDLVLVDRNCHKSLQHAITMTGAIPVYLVPERNEYGIIGPIPIGEFSPSSVAAKVKSSPLAAGSGSAGIKMAVVTNSTYDGLCYKLEHIEEGLKDKVDNIHFDEAWYGYACFHPLYRGRYGMSASGDRGGAPTIFATQSTHKVLAAFSQGSMIHVRSGRKPVEHDRFNEAFMMHTSTSPQYGIIASLDVAAKMMEGKAGRFLVEETLEEAVVFRKKMTQVAEEAGGREGSGGDWWFEVWQPDTVREGRRKVSFLQADMGRLVRDPECWTLKPNEDWHGFKGLEKDYIMLDPTKVTILTPGVRRGGSMTERGIPACIVTRFLRERGIVVEKTGFYSFLVLFTIGVTKGKSGTLLAELFRFKEAYDDDRALEEVFPGLVRENPGIYGGMTLGELCDRMHRYLRGEKLTTVIRRMYDRLPEPVLTPAEAYVRLVRGEVEETTVEELPGRVSAVMVVPYPPGIPVIMPGERYTPETRKIVDYLALCEEFDNRFPGFENEMHGVEVRVERGRRSYRIYCLAEGRKRRRR
jgi:lysine decarboxylase/arginine decarboxylase